MTIQLMPLSEVNHRAIRLLSEQIGVVDTFRFVNQFTTGHGNYTEERDALFDHLTLDDILSAIEKKRLSQSPNATQSPKENAADALLRALEEGKEGQS